MKHKLRRQFTEEYREQQNSMKRIGLISDTHGTFDQTLKTFLKDVDEIWHAGDIGSPEVADQIAAFKPLRAVYGNIDGGIMRRTYREFLSFECEGVSVLMTHIGGYPRRYDPRALDLMTRYDPELRDNTVTRSFSWLAMSMRWVKGPESTCFPVTLAFGITW